MVAAMSCDCRRACGGCWSAQARSAQWASCRGQLQERRRRGSDPPTYPRSASRRSYLAPLPGGETCHPSGPLPVQRKGRRSRLVASGAPANTPSGGMNCTPARRGADGLGTRKREHGLSPARSLQRWSGRHGEAGEPALEGGDVSPRPARSSPCPQFPCPLPSSPLRLMLHHGRIFCLGRRRQFARVRSRSGRGRPIYSERAANTRLWPSQTRPRA